MYLRQNMAPRPYIVVSYHLSGDLDFDIIYTTLLCERKNSLAKLRTESLLFVTRSAHPKRTTRTTTHQHPRHHQTPDAPTIPRHRHDIDSDRHMNGICLASSLAVWMGASVPGWHGCAAWLAGRLTGWLAGWQTCFGIDFGGW